MTPGKVPSEMGRLINRGRAHRAFQLGTEYVNNPECSRKAHFWFQLYLAHQLAHPRFLALEPRHAKSTWYYKQATQCDDFTPRMEGDFLRDAALAAVRAGDFMVADKLLLKALPYHQDDPNYEGVYAMVEGRIAAARGVFGAASQKYNKAARLFSMAGEARDVQWELNNAFHRYRTLRTGYRLTPSSKYVEKLFRREILRDDPSLLRRLRVGLLHFGGAMGYRLDRFVFGP